MSDEKRLGDLWPEAKIEILESAPIAGDPGSLYAKTKIHLFPWLLLVDDRQRFITKMRASKGEIVVNYQIKDKETLRPEITMGGLFDVAGDEARAALRLVLEWGNSGRDPGNPPREDYDRAFLRLQAGEPREVVLADFLSNYPEEEWSQVRGAFRRAMWRRRETLKELQKDD